MKKILRRRRLGLAVLALVVGALLQLSGTMLNQKVYAANGGMMPVWVINDDVAVTLFSVADSVEMSDRTRLPLLGDIIPCWFIDHNGNIRPIMLSIGDIFDDIGKILSSVAGVMLLFMIIMFFLRGVLWVWKEYPSPVDRTHPASDRTLSGPGTMIIDHL